MSFKSGFKVLAGRGCNHNQWYPTSFRSSVQGLAERGPILRQDPKGKPMPFRSSSRSFPDHGPTLRSGEAVPHAIPI